MYFRIKWVNSLNWESEKILPKFYGNISWDEDDRLKGHNFPVTFLSLRLAFWFHATSNKLQSIGYCGFDFFQHWSVQKVGRIPEISLSQPVECQSCKWRKWLSISCLLFTHIPNTPCWFCVHRRHKFHLIKIRCFSKYLGLLDLFHKTLKGVIAHSCVLQSFSFLI